ncbi:hypothetical protein [uncultured Algibacter sp.]|uniref:hypothetical protein n=1 Tax=uncultured Algibacter sp. TaxID=298659 RepID=UPI00260EE664|nr:hypothetical protein [uncultured Algibacter sp.]
MKFKIKILFVLVLVVSCKSDDDATSTTSNNESTRIDLVTGMYARASEFGPSIVLGNPNILDDKIFVYPNPAIGSVVVRSNAEAFSDVWLVKANPLKKFQDEDFSKIFNTSLYSFSEISSQAELSFLDIAGTNLSINLENLSSGYYKVFARINDEIFWTNIYVGNDKDIDTLINFWN